MHCGSAPCRARGTGPRDASSRSPASPSGTWASKTGAMNLRWPHSSPPWLTSPWPPSCRSRLSRTPLPSTSTARFSPRGSVRGPRRPTGSPASSAIIGLEPHSRWRHFVGTVADDPVATASTLLTDSTAGIYFVCTRPDARRRGFGAAITYEAMRHAAHTGATFAVLGSSPMGQGVYERLGFRTIYSTRLFELDA